jgi:AraC family transcriptional regulator
MQAELALSHCRACTFDFRRRAVERVIAAMRERLEEPMSLRDMAKIAYISPFHLNRVFHQVTGIPPAQYLYALRLEAAKRLLLTTARSVTDVCFEVGYNSLGTFTTRFTQLVGLSPCSLRRFAERWLASPFEPPPDNPVTPAPARFSGQLITGRVSSPVSFEGVIFVGLFKRQIPEGLPVSGTVLTGPGPFRIGPVPEDRYYAFAAAFADPQDPMDFLLPGGQSMYVGVCRPETLERRGGTRSYADIRLRPVQTTDPPILVALPYLLEKQQQAGPSVQHQ